MSDPAIIRPRRKRTRIDPDDDDDDEAEPHASSRKTLCTCSKCRMLVCLIDGEETQGCLVTPRTLKKHILRDQWDADFDAQQDALSSTILLTAASQPVSRQSSGILPVRRRDAEHLQTTVEDADDDEDDDVHERASAIDLTSNVRTVWSAHGLHSLRHSTFVAVRKLQTRAICDCSPREGPCRPRL